MVLYPFMLPTTDRLNRNTTEFTIAVTVRRERTPETSRSKKGDDSPAAMGARITLRAEAQKSFCLI